MEEGGESTRRVPFFFSLDGEGEPPVREAMIEPLRPVGGFTYRRAARKQEHYYEQVGHRNQRNGALFCESCMEICTSMVHFRVCLAELEVALTAGEFEVSGRGHSTLQTPAPKCVKPQKRGTSRSRNASLSKLVYVLHSVVKERC